MIQLPSDVPKAKEKPSRTHKGTQVLSSGHLSVSEGDSQKKRKKFSKELEREEESRDLTQDDTKNHLFLTFENKRDRVPPISQTQP